MRDTSVTLGSCFFWIVLFVIAICMQNLCTGIDALCIAFIWALHDGRWSRFLWLVPLLILIQEGGGSMDFGSSILWYASMTILFLLGRCVFAVESFVFMTLFSLAMGLVYIVLFNGLADLQDIYVSSSHILRDSIWQSAWLFFAWLFMIPLRQRFIRHAHTV